MCESLYVGGGGAPPACPKRPSGPLLICGGISLRGGVCCPPPKGFGNEGILLRLNMSNVESCEKDVVLSEDLYLVSASQGGSLYVRTAVGNLGNQFDVF